MTGSTVWVTGGKRPSVEETGAETIGIGDRSRNGSKPVLGISDVHRVKGDNESDVEQREVQAADASEPVGAPGTRGVTPCSWMPKTALESTEQAEVAANTLFPLLGFLGLTPKSAKVAPMRRSRPWSSKGMKRFCVATGARGAWAKDPTNPAAGPDMLLMPPGAAELLAGGHAAALAGGQAGC